MLSMAMTQDPIDWSYLPYIRPIFQAQQKDPTFCLPPPTSDPLWRSGVDAIDVPLSSTLHLHRWGYPFSETPTRVIMWDIIYGLSIWDVVWDRLTHPNSVSNILCWIV